MEEEEEVDVLSWLERMRGNDLKLGRANLISTNAFPYHTFHYFFRFSPVIQKLELTPFYVLLRLRYIYPYFTSGT